MFRRAKRRLLRSLFKRFFLPRLQELSGNRVVPLEYPAGSAPRYTQDSGPRPDLHPWFEAQSAACQSTLRLIHQYRADLEQIPVTAVDPLTPCWKNGWFTGLDAMSLYAFVASRRPRRIIEVGSGYSTKFAARAIRDHGLETTIVSIDPKPRAGIDQLCDRVVRSRVEHADLALFDELAAGDILFIDSSHRVFTGSDVTVLLLDVVPRLRPGVLLHIHDVFLPWDYPEEWSSRYYSEQYLLASLLLWQPARFRLLRSNVFVSWEPGLRRDACELLSGSNRAYMLETHFRLGGVRGLLGLSLWLEVRDV